MLAFLDRLCAALLQRRREEILQLLEHPLARVLPAAVRAESVRVAHAAPAEVISPVQTLHFKHQMAHLMGALLDPATRDSARPVLVGGDPLAAGVSSLAAAWDGGGAGDGWTGQGELGL